jgi:hypothetical protein
MPIIVLPETDNAYVTIAEIRALPNLGDALKFTDDELAQAREWFETTFEDYTGLAFVPRVATERVAGGSRTIKLGHWPVRSITAVRSYTSAGAFASFTTAELEDLQLGTLGRVKRYSLGYWPADVEIDYTHGQAAPPADVKREALVAIQEKLMEDNSGRPVDRTYGVATDGVFVRSILPGPDKPFGIASVDAVANRYRARYTSLVGSVQIA